MARTRRSDQPWRDHSRALRRSQLLTADEAADAFTERYLANPEDMTTASLAVLASARALAEARRSLGVRS